MNRIVAPLISMICIVLTCCTPAENIRGWQVSDNISFKMRLKDHTNIRFANTLNESPEFNYFTFSYIYAGAGVAIGDINNDDLPDIFFVGNDVKNQLYLNKGDLVFEDISQVAGIGGKEKLRWATGVNMVDINNDGWMDIYVCISGPSPDKQNLLYINNGDLSFTESARKYGIADRGFSYQSYFFDHDNDGDLDLYIATYPPCDFQSPNTYYVDKMQSPGSEETDRLYENNGDNTYTDITKQARITNYGLSLNASISDYNGDGWMDIYVSNDFNSPDYYYVNNQDGTYTEHLALAMAHTSNFGMGSDAADINNDGHTDLMQLDMMGATDEDRKKNMASMQPEIFYEAVELGLHHQYMRNCLQLNNGNGVFSDIAEMAGVANTDWSWSTLLADLNNDGWKDIFITNGMRRSVNNKDFQVVVQRLVASGQINDQNRHQLMQYLPVEPVKNKAFLNNGDLTFSEVNNEGLGYLGFTHGAAYGDLDLDGDLDMVINNLDKTSLIAENQSLRQNYLRLKLEGSSSNVNGIGAKVTITSGGQSQHQEMMPARGYLSSVEPILHFGLGSATIIDSLVIKWPGGSQEIRTNIRPNQVLKLNQSKATKVQSPPVHRHTYFNNITASHLDHKHIENEYDDFSRQVLLPHRMSTLGPAAAIGDINGDGLEDLFLGGASGQPGAIFLQNEDKEYIESLVPALIPDAQLEDTGAAFFDADSDGDLDLYVVSGGYEWPSDDRRYRDRLYINGGQGQWSVSNWLPDQRQSGSCVKPHDFDNDGDIDLLVCGRQVPGQYPSNASTRLLQNDGGRFTDVTAEKAPGLIDIGMVTDATWTDADNDGDSDIIVVGEWMPITYLSQEDGHFKNRTTHAGLDQSTGWWNTIESRDMDDDGDEDYIVGNLGLNYKYKTTPDEPFQLYYDDFDNNGHKDIALGYYEDGQLLPLRGRECSSQQVPILKEKFKSYAAFAGASFFDVYPMADTSSQLRLEAKTFASSYLENNGDGTFHLAPLPILAQVSCINGIAIADVDRDGVLDIIVAGNNYDTEVETPRNDASIGLWLKGAVRDGHYHPTPMPYSDLHIRGNTRDIQLVKTTNGHHLLVANNNGPWQLLDLSNESSILN